MRESREQLPIVSMVVRFLGFLVVGYYIQNWSKQAQELQFRLLV